MNMKRILERFSGSAHSLRRSCPKSTSDHAAGELGGDSFTCGVNSQARLSSYEYLNELGGQIRDQHARDFVIEEVRSHIEDQTESFEKEGMSHADALSKAVAEMGDPVQVGVELDRIHRPHMEWKFLGYVVFISILSLAVQSIVGREMYGEPGTEIFGSLRWSHMVKVILGIAAMLVVYRLDYTILTGKCRKIGAAYLIMETALYALCGHSYNGTGWIEMGSLHISLHAIMLLYLPLFAGILYEYRGNGRPVIAKIVLWILAPVISQLVGGYPSFPVIVFFLTAEMVLFGFALNRDWYRVNKKKVLLGGMEMLFTVMLLGLAVWYGNGYQKIRLLNWLAYFGIGSYASGDYEGINYVSSRLNSVFAHSTLLQKSEEAMRIMKEVPAYRNDWILGSVAAACGWIAVAVIIVCLVVLSAYVFRISCRQKNSLGYIIGCSCAAAIGLQSISNVLIVFGILPLTDSILPFFTSSFSYMFVDYVLLGLILSIYRYKDIRKEKIVAGMPLGRVE